MRNTLFGLFCCVFCFAGSSCLFWNAPAHAGHDALILVEAEPEACEGILSRFGKRLSQTWHSGSLDLYLPVYTWHNRLAYDSGRARKYNENPWGGGFGTSMVDEDGDTHALYLMGFSDSHENFQPIAGYAFIKNFYLDEAGDWAVGAGLTLGITGRHEYNYIPIPLPLPVFSVQYKDLALQAAYIPGGKNDGNVLFAWLRWHFY